MRAYPQPVEFTLDYTLCDGRCSPPPARAIIIFDPFSGSGTTAIAARELNRFFIGAELEEEFAKLSARRVAATKRGSMLREISEQFWAGG